MGRLMCGVGIFILLWGGSISIAHGSDVDRPRTGGSGTDGWQVGSLNDIPGMSLTITRGDGRGTQDINPQVAWTSNRGTHLEHLQLGVTCDLFQYKPMIVVDEMAYLFETAPHVRMQIDQEVFYATARPNPNPNFANFGFIVPHSAVEFLQSSHQVTIQLNGAYEQTHSLKGSRVAIDAMMSSCQGD